MCVRLLSVAGTRAGVACRDQPCGFQLVESCPGSEVYPVLAWMCNHSAEGTHVPSAVSSVVLASAVFVCALISPGCQCSTPPCVLWVKLWWFTTVTRRLKPRHPHDRRHGLCLAVMVKMCVCRWCLCGKWGWGGGLGTPFFVAAL